jgi:hypothetical protein
VLASVIRGRLDNQVRDRILAEARGNPLALLQLPLGFTPAELAGGFGVPGLPALASRIAHGFRRQFEALPDDTRRLLLTAAAEPTGDVTLLCHAAERQSIDPDATAPALPAGLLEPGARVRFGHPLVRSAVYRSAPSSDRRSAHQALAEVTAPTSEPDRRAWHRAHATEQPDEAVAEGLACAAGRAQARGGLAAAAAFLKRAAELTPDPARRSVRALAAAEAELGAGAPDKAHQMLATAEWVARRASARAPRTAACPARVLAAPRQRRTGSPAQCHRLAPLDVTLARDTYLDALGAAIFAGRLGGEPGLRVMAVAVRAAPAAPPARATNLLLDGLFIRFH